MPIYLYRCDSCGQNHEALQKVSDAVLRTCPHCGAEELRKLIAPVGVIFKGSGFHKNDYSSSGGGGGAKKSEGQAAGGETSDKSESATSSSASDSGGSSDGGGSGDSSPSSPKSDKVA